jgi:Spy/CpxP family protein refolding chaperone
MKRVSLLTLFVFLATISTSLVVEAGERKYKDRNRWDRRGQDSMKHRSHCMKYKHKYMKYKKKYYHLKKNRHEKHDDESKLKHFWKSIKTLDLTSDQKDRLHQLKYDWKLEKTDLSAQKKKQKIRLHRLKQQDAVNRDQLSQRLNALYDAKAAYKKALYGFKLDVKNVLTDQQRTSLKKMKQKHRGRKHDRKNHSGDHDKKDRDGSDSY